MKLFFEYGGDLDVGTVVGFVFSEVVGGVGDSMEVVGWWGYYLSLALPVFGREGDGALEVVVVLWVGLELWPVLV